MRAMQIQRYGDASEIRPAEVPTPVPGPGEALIRVAATSFNPSDVGLRLGLLRDVLPLELPLTLGMDVAGTVVDTAPGAVGVGIGDRVMGRVAESAAEFVTAPADLLAPAPASVPLSHAAAVPVAGLTAWQAVHDHARITAGQRVLISGAGGGVGGFAVQLAKHAGAHVVATASPRSADVVRTLGADEIVDYTAAKPTGPFDVILSLVDAPDLLELLRPGGVFVSITRPVDAPGAVHFVARNDLAQLRAMAAMIDAGTLRLDISATHPLTDLADVHRAAEAGRTRGKIILTP